MTKTILIRIFYLSVVLVVLNTIYNFTLYENFIAEVYPEKIRIQKTQDSADLFYFGESSNVTFSENDSITKSISELTNDYFPSLTIQPITKYATHAGIYKYWLNEINLKAKKPKALIITLNLRSFDAAWIHSRLESQLQESIVMSKPFPNLVNRFLLSLQAFDNKSQEEREQDMLEEWDSKTLLFPFYFQYQTVKQWDDAMAKGSYLNSDGSWNIEKINLACHYIKAFAFNLNDANPRIKDYDDIANWCNQNKINLYLNLMAENCYYADSLVGKELVFLMKQNRDFLVQRYSNSNCKVIDNLEIVEGKYFIDQNWTTEHYNDKGRKKIAKNLANSLKSQFINEYKEVY